MAESQTQLGAFESTREGVAAVMAKQRELNGQNRTVQEIPEPILELSKKTEVYIFNVGPWPQHQLMGSLGSFYIPACPEGKPYSPALVIPGLVIEHYPLREGALDLLMNKNSDGWTTAQQIIGVGRHLMPANSLVKYGVFASRSNPPKAEDLSRAREALRQHCTDLVNEANAAMAQGPKAAEETIRPEQHFIAARLLKKTEAECPWLNRSVERAERKNCDICGAIYEVGRSVCPNNHIVDKALFEKQKDRFLNLKA